MKISILPSPPASDGSDYIEFVIPLLCLGGIFVISSRYKEKFGIPSVIVSIGLILIGMLLLFIGALSLGMQIKSNKSIPRILFLLVVALSFANGLFCLLPFVYQTLEDEVSTLITVGVMMLVGFIWAGIGAGLLTKGKVN